MYKYFPAGMLKIEQVVMEQDSWGWGKEYTEQATIQ